MRRNRTEQLISILETCNKPNGMKALHISYKSNLNGYLMNKDLRFLEAKKLLEKLYPMQKTHRKQTKFPFYHLTEEGKRVVSLYREVEQALELKV